MPNLRNLQLLANQASLADQFVEDFDDYDDSYPPPCSNPGGHEWAYSGTAYGGDDERWGGEGRCYCLHCGADGDA